jgi:phage tail sheath protein FI
MSIIGGLRKIGETEAKAVKKIGEFVKKESPIVGHFLKKGFLTSAEYTALGIKGLKSHNLSRILDKEKRGEKLTEYEQSEKALLEQEIEKYGKKAEKVGEMLERMKKAVEEKKIISFEKLESTLSEYEGQI